MVAQDLIITAHRGASAAAPENTLAAIQAALKIGVDRIEVDVATTKDGTVVCLHDKDIDRTCQQSGDIREFTMDDLKTIRANVGFENAFPLEGIPTLNSVFETIDGACELVIEIKSGNDHYPRIEKKVAKLIEDHDAYSWAVVHSFNDKVLDLLPTLDQNVRLQKLFVFRWSWIGLMQDMDTHFGRIEDYPNVEAFGVYRKFVSQDLIDDIHELGKQIHVWTVDDEDEIIELIEMGVDGIISNRPDLVKMTINRK